MQTQVSTHRQRRERGGDRREGSKGEIRERRGGRKRRGLTNSTDYHFSRILIFHGFRPQMVISLLDRMKAENVLPNTIVLTAAIDSLAREGGGEHTSTYCYCYWYYYCCDR
jgi:hypothetical protein